MKNVIYKISNNVNTKIYVGSASYFPARKSQHIFNLKNNKHHSIILQNHVNKYGIDTLKFEILEKCEEHNLIQKEQYYLDKLKPYFNVRKIAESNKGTKRTPEQIQKMLKNRVYKKGYKRPKEVVDKIKKTRIDNGGYFVSEKQKLNHSKKMKGRKVKEEVKVKISKTMKGKTFSETHRKKLSNSAKGNTNWKNVDYKNKERNKKISISLKKIKSKPVINKLTGERYNSIKEAAEHYGVAKSTLAKNLSGYTKINKTPFIYEKQ